MSARERSYLEERLAHSASKSEIIEKVESEQVLAVSGSVRARDSI
jgi:uncharacterized protein YciI